MSVRELFNKCVFEMLHDGTFEKYRLMGGDALRMIEIEERLWEIEQSEGGDVGKYPFIALLPEIDDKELLMNVIGRMVAMDEDGSLDGMEVVS